MTDQVFFLSLAEILFPGIQKSLQLADPPLIDSPCFIRGDTVNSIIIIIPPTTVRFINHISDFFKPLLFSKCFILFLNIRGIGLRRCIDCVILFHCFFQRVVADIPVNGQISRFVFQTHFSLYAIQRVQCLLHSAGAVSAHHAFNLHRLLHFLFLLTLCIVFQFCIRNPGLCLCLRNRACRQFFFLSERRTESFQAQRVRYYEHRAEAHGRASEHRT